MSKFIPTLDRYIIGEICLFFLFSVGLFSALGVTIGTVSDLAYKITEYNLPIPVAILIFVYKIPEYVGYALPISILLSILIVYGRLSSDRELVAFFSFGISLQRIIVPTLIFSLLVTAIAFLFNESIVPAANYQANLLQNPFISETELNLTKRDIFYPEYEPNHRDRSAKTLKTIYFAEQYRNETLQKVTIISFDRGRIKRIITARLATWNSDRQTWNLTQGELNQIDLDNAEITTKQFTKRQLSLSPTVFEIAKKNRSPDDMNIRQAKEYLNIIRDSGKKTDIAKFAVRIQQKYAFPFICIVFALIGSVIGAKYTQMNRSQGFGLCVAIVFAYYSLGFTFGSLGISGLLSPFWAAWIPNFMGIITGGWLLSNQ